MENNQLPLVTFEQAKRLKKAGFDWGTPRVYKDQDGKVYNWGTPYKISHNNGEHPDYTSAPTVALALKWIRDEHGLHTYFLCPQPKVFNGRSKSHWSWGIEEMASGYGVANGYGGSTYNEAESICLDNALYELLNLIDKRKDK